MLRLPYSIEQNTICHFNILPINGVDLVLGIEWLKTLGSIITDYSTLTIQFQLLGQENNYHTEQISS